MILLYSILAGLLAGLARAWLTRRDLHFPEIRLFWIAPAAFLPQYLAFQLAVTRKLFSDDLAAWVLVGTQLLLLGFVWFNRRQPGFWLLGIGLAFNLLVITFNGGFMPISPETVSRLAPEATPGAWQVGDRLGSTKDIVLPAEDIRLEWLSDRFLFAPDGTRNRVAFSLGDVMIALGAFWFCWNLNRTSSHKIFDSLEHPGLSISVGNLGPDQENEYGD